MVPHDYATNIVKSGTDMKIIKARAFLVGSQRKARVRDYPESNSASSPIGKVDAFQVVQNVIEGGRGAG